MMNVLLIALSWITLVGAEPPQPAAQQQLRSSQVVEFFVAFLERQLVQAADAMPANKYSFAPTVGEFSGVRTFGQQVKRLAATNYMLAAGALGERPPDDAGDQTGPEDLRMKADILDYLRGSFRALHRAAAAIDDGNAVVGDVPISPLTGQATRLGYVLEALLHTYDQWPDGDLPSHERHRSSGEPQSMTVV